MAITAIDKEITSYLPLLNENQKEAILTVMKTFTQEPSSTGYEEAFMNELEERFSEYETGKTESFTLEETENRAREFYQAKKK